MKKIILVASAAAMLSSCCMDMDSYYWKRFDYKEQPYENYAADVMTTCVAKPLLTLDYIQRVYETARGKKIVSGSYFVYDEFQYMVGPIECKIEGKDTLWSFDSGRYLVKRDDARTWNVTMADKKDGEFSYDFHLTAVMPEHVEPKTVRMPWKIRLEGSRYENSRYHLDFVTSDFSSRCSSPWSFDSHELLYTGTLAIRFFKDDAELDWLTAVYGDGAVLYQKSF